MDCKWIVHLPKRLALIIPKAGAAAAFTVDLLVYPLDTLKTRWQSPDYTRLFVDASTNTANKRALFRGLYQGVGSVIVATLPACTIPYTLSPKPSEEADLSQQEHSSLHMRVSNLFSPTTILLSGLRMAFCPSQLFMRRHLRLQSLCRVPY